MSAPRPLDPLNAPAARSRWRGTLLGLAVGDALGTTLEFAPPGSFEPLTEIVGGGPFGLLPGQWTDDTSMALCLAESLLECGTFDPVDQLERYLRWYRDGHWSSTGSCFDIGGATSAALVRFEARPTLAYPGDEAPHAGGNGPLMKVAPVVMAFAGEGRLAIEHAERSARTTHGHPAAIAATAYFAGLLLGAINGSTTDELLRGPEPFEPIGALWSDQRSLHPEVLTVARGSFRERQPPAIAGGGYAVHALEAALSAVHRSDDFEQAVLAAANLGDDADTTAAIAGQLAGAIHGVDAIPARWRELVHRGDKIVEVADALYDLAMRPR